MKKKLFITVIVIAILFALGIVVICMFPQLNKETIVFRFDVDYRTSLKRDFFEPDTKFPTDKCEYITITQKRFSECGYNRHFIYVRYASSRVIHQYVLNIEKDDNIDVDEKYINERNIDRYYNGSLLRYHLYTVKGSKNSQISIENITFPASLRKSENAAYFMSFGSLVERINY